MKKIILIMAAALLLFAGCAEKIYKRKRTKAQKKIESIKTDFPDLFTVDTTFITTKDTLIIPIDKYVFDTTLTTTLDSVLVETDKVRTIVKVLRDTKTKEVIKWRVRTEIKSDTVFYYHTDTIQQINTEIETKTVTKTVRYIPWWIYAIIIISLLLLLYLGFRLLIGTIDNLLDLVKSIW